MGFHFQEMKFFFYTFSLLTIYFNFALNTAACVDDDALLLLYCDIYVVNLGGGRRKERKLLPRSEWKLRRDIRSSFCFSDNDMYVRE